MIPSETLLHAQYPKKIMKLDEEDPQYQDLLFRAAKVRHFLAKNPGTSYSDIAKHFFPMKCPVQWLLNQGYVYRKSNPDPSNFAPVYYPKPLGVPFEEPAYEDSPDEEVALASKKIRDSRVDEI